MHIIKIKRIFLGIGSGALECSTALMRNGKESKIAK
jgi:hypothetical protein